MNSLSKYLIALFHLLFIAHFVEAQQIKDIKLQLKWKHQFQFAGYYAAIEKGYYKEAGIHVNLVEAVEGKNPIDAVFEGKAEFGVSSSDILLYEYQNNKPVVLASIFQHSPQILLASKKSGIAHVQDLIGKKIALEENAADIIAYMNDEGVSLDECIINNHAFDVEMLINGDVDAISAYSTDEPFVLKEANFDYTIISPTMGGIDFYGDVLFTTQSLIEKNPSLVNNFREASLKGWKYAMEHTEEMIDLIYNNYSKRHSKEHLQFEAGHMKNLIMPNVVEIGYTNIGRWQSIADTYKKQKILDGNFTIEGLLYSDYQKPTLVIPWNLIVILLLIIISIGSVAFFFYKTSRNLQNEIRNRLEIEKNLLESEARYRSILNASPDSIAITDLDGHIIMTSPAALKMFGFKNNDEANGKLVTDFIMKEDRARAAANISLMFQGVFTGLVEYRGLHADGSIFEMESNAEFIRNKEGEPIQIIFVVRDIAARKMADKQIRKLSVAVEQNPATIVITDLNGNIEYANPKFTELTGYNFNEAKGNNPRLLKSGKTEEKVFKEMWETISSGKIWKGEFVNKKKNDEEFIENAIIAPIFSEEGEIISYISIKEDITDRKKAELIIKQQIEELKELNSTKDKFFSIISHDLRSPFSNLLGISELLLENYQKFADEKRLQFIKSIYETSKQTFTLLENLLEWSRMQRGKFDFNPEQISLTNLIIIEIQNQKNIATAKNIEISLLSTDQKMIFADANMLHTILRNLIGNAIKFTKNGGKISIDTTEKSGSMEITVSDNGVGVSTENLEKLFQIDADVKTKGTANEKGTGLGLVLCKEFVEKHGGEIWAVSELDKGTEFKFTIPIKDFSLIK